MYFKVDDSKLLKKYNKIWGKISNLMNIEFDSEPVYGDNYNYIKTKIKSYGDKINTNFRGKKVPKENVSYNCLSLIMSVIRVNKKYYPQTLLEEYKYILRKNKMENLINDDLDLSSSDDHRVIVMSLMMNLIVRLIINFDSDELCFNKNNKSLMYDPFP